MDANLNRYIPGAKIQRAWGEKGFEESRAKGW
jgi:hypothetical protein